MNEFDSKKPRKASVVEEARFREAFTRLLTEGHEPPGPTALAREMGWSSRQLNGRTTKLRKRLMREAGFGFNETLNRWVR